MIGSSRGAGFDDVLGSMAGVFVFLGVGMIFL